MFVFEIVSLKGLNKFFDQIIFFFDCWVKDLFAIMGESLETFPFWELTFESSLSKGLNVLAIFRYVVKKSRYLARGRQEENFLLPGLLSRD